MDPCSCQVSLVKRVLTFGTFGLEFSISETHAGTKEKVTSAGASKVVVTPPSLVLLVSFVFSWAVPFAVFVSFGKSL